MSISRRTFAAAAITAAVGTQTTAAQTTSAPQKPEPPITAASLPDDPDAPRVAGGTQPVLQPFETVGPFRPRSISPKVDAFSLPEVRLLPSEFLLAQEMNRQYLHDLPLDRLLHNFRMNAGLPSSAAPLGGWEKPDCELRGHFVGHYLSACSLMYAATGDEALKAKGRDLVAGLAACQQKLAGGYLSAFPLELFDRLQNRQPVWAPFYTIHKIMAGLVDNYQLCANQQALTVVKGMAGWADRWSQPLTGHQMQMVLDTEYGGMNDILYILADVTGDPHYGEIGDRFTKKRFFNPLANHRDELRGLHVNTHIPQVIGAARRYELTGDRRFSEVAAYFYTEVTTARAYATGGTSNNESWLTDPNQLAAELKQRTDTTECCCAYNMLKLSRLLHQQSGDPRHIDYFERTLYNHRLGTVQPNGAMQYYLGITPGTWRTFSTSEASFWCCDGTGVEEYSKLADSIYFHDESGVYINLFIPSTLQCERKGFHLRQETHFPDTPTTKLIVEKTNVAPMSLHLRVPQWVSAPIAARVNSKPSDAIASPGSYLTLRRRWQTGDIIELDLPMKLRYEALPDDERMRAILYGPLVLAAALGSQGLNQKLVVGPSGPALDKIAPVPIPAFAVGAKEPAEWLRPTGEPLTFSSISPTSGGQSREITFAPLHRLQNQRYSIYCQIT